MGGGGAEPVCISNGILTNSVFVFNIYSVNKNIDL